MGWLSVASSLIVHTALLAALAWWSAPRAKEAPPGEPLAIEIRRIAPENVNDPAPKPENANVNVNVNDPVPAPKRLAAVRTARDPSKSTRDPGFTVQSTNPASTSEPGPPAAPTWLSMRGDGVRGGAPFPQLDFRGGMRFGDGGWFPAPPDPGRDMPGLGAVPLDPDGDPAGPVLMPDGDGGLRYERKTFVARVARDGTVAIIDRPNLQGQGFGCQGCDGRDSGLPGWSASFDLTDALMRAHGEDPYRYEKAKFLEETFELRAAMAAADRLDRLKEAVRRLPETLDRIWSYTTWSAAERRRVFFELWDECAEEGDDPLLEAAGAARRHIVGFIRSRLAEGTADGYTRDELDALNTARHSVARFEPYAE